MAELAKKLTMELTREERDLIIAHREGGSLDVASLERVYEAGAGCPASSVRSAGLHRAGLLAVAKAARGETEKFRPRSIEEFMIDDKCNFFDKMYEMAASTLKNVQDDGHAPKDIEQSMYEEVMELLTPTGKQGKVFWDYFNQINRG